jgi:hypothetical protein
MDNTKFIQAYEFNKRAFHSDPINIGKQLHHIHGRGNDKSKILLCCWLNFQALSIDDHQNHNIIKYLKEKNMTIKYMIMANYQSSKGGCVAELCDYCLKCPIYVSLPLDKTK